MKSTRKVVQKTEDTGVAAESEIQSTKKRVAKAKVGSGQNEANGQLVIQKITLTESGSNSYNISALFSDGDQVRMGEITVAHVQNFTADFSDMAKQVKPTSRTPLPRPPKFIEITY